MLCFKALMQLSIFLALLAVLVDVSEGVPGWRLRQRLRQRLNRPRKKPNILFIFADDYGYNDIGYHGSDIQTPNLDRLAASGVKLENYYVQPVCTPSRSQLMSGRYQIHTGLQHAVIQTGQPNGLPLQFPTLAEKIHDAGYSTHMIGKWHLGYHKREYLPVNRGFDTFFGIYNGAGTFYNHTECVFSQPDVCGFDIHNGTNPASEAIGVYSTFLYTDETCRIIQSQPDNGKPMFIFLSLQNPRPPYEVPSEYEEPYQNLPGFRRTINAAKVAMMDEAIGNVTRALKEKGILDNTVIIFSADNGGGNIDGSSNWPWRGQKLGRWEGGIRAIGFAAGTGLRKVRGTTYRGMIHVSDWYPTLVDLAGGRVRGQELDGYNVWPSIARGTPSPRQEILININPRAGLVGVNPFDNSTFDVRQTAALRVGDMKIMTGDPGPGTRILPNATEGIVHFATRGFQGTKNLWLFNITADPYEQNDLSASRPDIVREMLDKLKVYENGAVPALFPPYDPNSNPALGNGYWEPWL